jgi:hypothetical protein
MSLKAAVAVLASLVFGQAAAQNAPLSTDGTDPKTWDPALDALVAG